MQSHITPHPVVIFEGVDGVGKSTLAHMLARYHNMQWPEQSLYHDAFPGTIPGTLGEWVYRFHHGRIPDGPVLSQIAAPALQMLHIAAHIDTLLMRMKPSLQSGGSVILDRSWWSTYAYSRTTLSNERAWNLVQCERRFWDDLPQPLVVYLTRRRSLKPEELDVASHHSLAGYYKEILHRERDSGGTIIEIANDGTLQETWTTLLTSLGYPLCEQGVRLASDDDETLEFGTQVRRE